MSACIISLSNLIQLIFAKPQIFKQKDLYMDRSNNIYYLIINLNFGLLPQLMALCFFSRNVCPGGAKGAIGKHDESFSSSRLGKVVFKFDDDNVRPRGSL